MTALSPRVGRYNKEQVHVHSHVSKWTAALMRTLRSVWSPEKGPRFSAWPTALIGIVALKALLSLVSKPDSALLSYGGIPYFVLLMLATAFAIRNGIQNTLRSRPFWLFLGIAYGLWALDQSIYLYYQLALISRFPTIRLSIPCCFCTLELSWRPWRPSPTGTFPNASHTH